MSGAVRDTDDDWREIGAKEPYWGVLSDDRFAQRNIDAAAIDEFYASGRSDIDTLVERASALLGPWRKPAHALDFGCGAGRLSLAMTQWASLVTGFDISPGMLEVARRRAGDRSDLRFTHQWPDGPFDWINSYIVFQHIPPVRGLEILDGLLERLAEDGVVTLHFTFYRDAALRRPRTRTGLVRALRRVLGRTAEPRVGSISMFDYDLDAVAERLNRHGIERVLLIHTDHGGHHGAHVIGRREA